MEVRRLRPSEGAAKAIVDVVTRVKHLETRPSGTIYLDDTLIATDPETGNEIHFGVLPDGTFGIDPNVNDTTPPGPPSTPTVTGVMGGLEVWWDGKEQGGSEQPKDFWRADIEYALEGSNEWTLGGTFTNANGTVIGGLEIGTKYRVRLISYDYNANASDPSVSVPGIPVSFVDNEDVDNALRELRESDRENASAAAKAQQAAGGAHDAATAAGDAALKAAGIANGKGRVIYAPTAPTAAEDKNVNNLWVDTSGDIPKNTPHRWDEKTTKWVVITDKAALDAGIKAGNAEQIANAASAAAAAAASAAGQAQTAANSKNRVWYLPTPPAGDDHKVGDTWFDTSNGNMINRWTGSEWVTAQDAFIAKADKKAEDAAAAAVAAGTTATNAATAAENAAKAAGAKGKVIIQNAAPDAADRLPQNLWIDTTGGANTPKRWNGQAWVAVTDKKATDAADAAVAAKNRADEAFNLATTAAETAGEAQKSADGKNRVWYSDTTPTGTGHRIGDTWFDASMDNMPKVWDGSAWISVQDKSIAKADKKAADAATAATAAGTTATNAQTAADNAAKAAGAKGKVIIQSTAPDAADRLPQNLWIDTTGGTNTPKRWVSGTTWAAVTDKVAQDAANAAVAAQKKADDAFILAGSAAASAGLAQESADGKNKVWYSTTAPTGTLHRTNDLWFDEANGNRPMRWDGAEWVSTQDQVFKAIEQNVEKVTQSANGKNSIYYAATAPVSTTAKPLVVGDTWFDTANGNRVKVWSGSPAKWNDAVDALLTETAASVTEARRVADGKNSIYYEATAPVSTTAKPLVKGDTWFNTSKNYQMSTYTGSTWQITQDSKAALDAANGKNKVSTGATAPASPTVGDTWIDTANGNVIKIYTASGWVAYQDKAIKEAKDAATGAQDSANGKNNNTYSLDAPTTALGTGRTVGDTWFRIDNNGAVYAQWTWSGTKWDTVAMRHEVIASIDAGKISTGTMDAKFITANTITTDQMMVGFGTNLIPNAGFEVSEGPHGPSGVTVSTWSTVDPYSGMRSIILSNANVPVGTFTSVYQISSGVKSSNGYLKHFDVKTDTDYVVSFYAKSSGTVKAGQQVRAAMFFYGPTGTYLSSRGGTAIALKTTWGLCEYIVERSSIPAGTSSVTLSLQTDQPNAVQIDDWFFGEKINGSLLVKGSITADLGILGEAVVGTAQITDLGVTTAKIAELAVTDAKISNIHAGKISAGEIDAARIGAKTITVDKLLVSSTDNLVSDADFSDEAGRAWTGGYSNASITWDATGGRNGGPAVKHVAKGAQFGRYGISDLPATGGSAYRVLAWVKSSATIPAKGVAIYYRQKVVGSTAYYSPNISNDAALAANVWHPISGIVKLQADATSVNFGVHVQAVTTTGTIWVDYLSATRAADGELVVDGSIKSTSITADGLDAGVIKFGSMDGGLIKADSITSASLAITDMTNFAPSIVSNTAEWTMSGGMKVVSSTATPEGKRFDATGMSGTAWAYGPMKDVAPGDKLYGEATGYRGSTVTNLYFRYYFYDKSKTELNYVQAPQAANTATAFSLTVTVPATAVYAQLVMAINGGTTATGGFYAVRGFKQAPSTLIENGAITTDHMTVGTIDAKVIRFNTITGSMIQAKTINTDSLLITSTDNLIQEADFGAKGLGWDDLTTTAISTTAGRNGGPALQFSASTATQTVYNKYTAAVEPLASYRMFAWIKPSVAMAAGHFALIAAPTPGSAISINNKAIAANTWAKVEGMITVPEGTNTIKFGVRVGSGYSSGTVAVDFVSVTRASDGNLIVDGSITTNSMKAGTIDGNRISANSISGTEIMAKTITVDNMLISSTDNFIHEADFSNKGTGWSIAASWANIVATAGRNGGPALVFTNTSGAQSVYNLPYDMPFEGEQNIRVSAWVKSSVAATSGTLRIGVRSKGPTGATTFARYDYDKAVVANAWTRIQGIVKLPGDTVSVSFYIESVIATGTTTWDYVSATRAAGAELIVDGSITTNSIVSSGIDASVITVGTMSGERISAQSISAEKLVIGLGANTLADPNFLSSETNAARGSRSTGTWTFPVDGGTGLQSARTTTATTNNAFMFSPYTRSAANAAKMTPVIPGEVYQFNASVYTNISAGVRWNLELVYADGTASYIAGSPTNTAAGRRELPTWEYTIPANCVAMSPALACLTTGVTWIIDQGAQVVRKVTGSLIVDGAIDGKTITGALIQSVSASNRGIKMNATEFVAYNNLGVETLRLSGNTATITGATVRTAATGARVIMDSNGLRAYPPSGSTPYLNASDDGLALTGTLATVTTVPMAGTVTATLGPISTGGGIGSKVTIPGLSWLSSSLASTTDSPPSIGTFDGKTVTISGRTQKNEQQPAAISVGDSRDVRIHGDVIVQGRLRQDTPMGRHLEWTSSVAVARAKEVFLTAGSLDTSHSPGWNEPLLGSTDYRFALWIASTASLGFYLAGAYQISVKAAATAGIVGTAYIVIYEDDYPAAISYFEPGGNLATLSANFYMPMGGAVKIAMYHSNSASLTTNFRVKATVIA